MIETIELTKHYHQADGVVHALDGVSIRIDRGEFVSIIGRSGSGKTTLLDMIGLLGRPTTGTIFLDGAATSHMSDKERARLRATRIGFVFQEYNLLPTMSALENVMLPMEYAGGSRRDHRQRALSLLKEVGLADRAGHRPSQLSGGQQQRVAIARALANAPAIVLADEPTGAVDSETGAELIATMRQANREHGVTFAIVTHDTELASQTDRIIRLRDGRVEEADTRALAV